MHNIGNLSELPQGETAVVTDIRATNNMRRRLNALGLTVGAEVRCIRQSPLGDPTAFLIQGAVIALRCEDSACVWVQFL